MAPVVVIPQNYEDLPPIQREEIVPICITACDRYGQEIAPEWFFDGVAPVRKQLVRIAQYALGDPWCVSELAETTVHRLWARYGAAVGRYPARRVLKKAMWLGEELKIGDWRRRKYPNLYVALDALDEKIREQALADPNEYAALFERQIMLDSVEDRLRQEGQDRNADRVPSGAARIQLAGGRRASRRGQCRVCQAPLLSLDQESSERLTRELRALACRL